MSGTLELDRLRCPTPDEVHEVLDREAAPETARSIVEHVHECTRCNAGFSTLFEVDGLARLLWSDATSIPLRPAVRVEPAASGRSRSRAGLAVAAALCALVTWLAAAALWRSPADSPRHGSWPFEKWSVSPTLTAVTDCPTSCSFERRRQSP